MKKISKRQTNNTEQRSTTKKYIERIIETKEAEAEIKEFVHENFDGVGRDFDTLPKTN